jgi:hypothetical protein
MAFNGYNVVSEELANVFAQSDVLGGGYDYWHPPEWNSESHTPEMHFPPPIPSNYAGPMTKIKKRWVEKGWEGTTQLDSAAKLHDIRYYNIGKLKNKGKISDNQVKQAVIKADDELVKVASNPEALMLKDLTKPKVVANKLINKAQSAVVAPIISAKSLLTSANVLSPTLFTKISEAKDGVDNEEKDFISEERPEMVKNLPADYLGLHLGGKKPKKPPQKQKVINRLAKLEKRFTKI